MENRLEAIEIKLMLSEDLLDELNKTVYRQQRQIDQLQQDLISLRKQVLASLPNEPRHLSEEIPPHY